MSHPASEVSSEATMLSSSATALRSAFLRGKISAEEMVSAAVKAAEADQLGAFLSLEPEAAVIQARQTDEVRAMLAQLGGLRELSAAHPLLGLPTALKDLVNVAGMPTTFGSAAVEHPTPARDDRLPRRVHRSGAISVGKTQVPEFGLPCYSENELGPAARNPLDPSRTSGGSTGGGATAVAAGLLPFAPGSDGGGSIRIPAAACGLVGLKPGRGRMPDDPQRQDVRNLAVSGPIARSAADAALLFDVMAGSRFRPAPSGGRGGSRTAGSTHTAEAVMTPAEGPAMAAVRQALDRGLDTLTVRMTTDSPFTPDLDVALADQAVNAYSRGAELLGALGHRLIDEDRARRRRGNRIWPEDYHRRFRALWTSGLASSSFSAEQERRLEPLTRYFLELARSRPPEETAAAVGQLQRAAREAESIFADADVLMTPMLASAAPEVGFFAGLDPAENYEAQCRFTPYSSVVNVLGLPAINVPVLQDEAGLSWSVHLIGRHGAEEQLLALAATMTTPR
ncbi:amidase [Nesterenkonia aerolata]|uniref:Amidase n=1 Tax=Nesterenkonia aerolata TaxID=3074079 RepID=A0ABU2DU57_9MICC|nr:amidase [Nesterenkonia sp. LY-0111]MDR8020038.1 amidase [Nesterenkonia sp. LY-0111]